MCFSTPRRGTLGTDEEKERPGGQDSTTDRRDAAQGSEWGSVGMGYRCHPLPPRGRLRDGPPRARTPRAASAGLVAGLLLPLLVISTLITTVGE